MPNRYVIGKPGVSILEAVPGRRGADQQSRDTVVQPKSRKKTDRPQPVSGVPSQPTTADAGRGADKAMTTIKGVRKRRPPFVL
jgi:hypothetical protein